MSIFSKSKGQHEAKSLNKTEGDDGPEEPASDKSSLEMDTTIGRDIRISGNIVCVGTIKIFGRVIGDIHASHLVICKDAYVEGKVTTEETVIDGVFKGTIYSNSVKLQGAAMVDGEIVNKSLTIEQNVQFEGMSRRLKKPVDPPLSVSDNDGVPLPTSLTEAAQVIPEPTEVRTTQEPAETVGAMP